MQFDKEFKISIVNAISLKEQFSDIIEALLDSQTENEFVKELPIVGWVMKSVGVVDKIKTKFLVNSSPTFNNHYIAVKDEVVFDYGLKQLTQENRAFLYILTINTHLPFHTNKNTSEFQSQFNRIQEQFI